MAHGVLDAHEVEAAGNEQRPERMVEVVPAERAQAGRRHGRAWAKLDGGGATLSHMEIGVRDLRNRTAQVIDAVKAGERVTLSVHGEPVADIVPHGQRTRWLSGPQLRSQLAGRAADAALSRELDELAGQTLDEL